MDAKFKKIFLTFILLMSLFSTNLIHSNEVSIEKAVFKLSGTTWSIDITLKHQDSGWKHYADAWRVVDAKGQEIKKRTLFHPHVNEQPFTRSLSKVSIPMDTKVVYIEAHDTVHKWSPRKLEINLVNNKLDNVKVYR